MYSIALSIVTLLWISTTNNIHILIFNYVFLKLSIDSMLLSQYETFVQIHEFLQLPSYIFINFISIRISAVTLNFFLNMI